MEPPVGDEGQLAAVGFSIAMWAFLAMAVLGLILKFLG